MWTIFQILVFTAVMASDIIYKWGEGPMVAPFIALTLAYSASCILAWAIDLFRGLFTPKPTGAHIGYSAQQSRYKRLG